MADRPAVPPIELAREGVRQGEARLEAVMGLSTAAVARATTLCGIFGAASVTVMAAVLAYLSAEKHAASLVWGGSVTAVTLLAASALAACAGAARQFRIKGGKPTELWDWAWDAERACWRSEVALLKVTGDRLTAAIEDNRRLLRKEGRITNAALIVGLSSLLAGLLTYVLVVLRA